MIAKIIFPLLLLAGFINFSSLSATDEPVSKKFLSLHDDAMKACAINSTLSLIENYNGHGCTLHYECLCPFVCYVQKLGIVNDGGLNKIAVNWIRTLMDLGHEIFNANIEQSAGPSRLTKLPAWASNKSIEAMFYVSQKEVVPLSHACSLKNETAFDIVGTEIQSLIEEQYEKENPDEFIPSEEDSPFLELIVDVTNTCSTKFNTSSFTMAIELIRRRTERLPPNKSLCYIVCLLSELDFVNETGLNEPWAGVVADLIGKHEGALAVINDGVISVNSKCSGEINDIPDNYFVGVFREIESKLRKNGL